MDIQERVVPSVQIDQDQVLVIIVYYGSTIDNPLDIIQISRDKYVPLGKLKAVFPQKWRDTPEAPKSIYVESKIGLSVRLTYHEEFTIQNMMEADTIDSDGIYYAHRLKGQTADSYVKQLYPGANLILYVRDIVTQEDKISYLRRIIKDCFEKNKLRVGYRLYTSGSPNYSIDENYVGVVESNHSLDVDPEKKLPKTKDLESFIHNLNSETLDSSITTTVTEVTAISSDGSASNKNPISVIPADQNFSNQRISQKNHRENKADSSLGRAPQGMFSHKPKLIVQELELVPSIDNRYIAQDNCFLPCVIF